MRIHTFPSILNRAHPAWAPEAEEGGEAAETAPETTGSSDDDDEVSEDEREIIPDDDEAATAEPEAAEEPAEAAAEEAEAEDEEEQAPKPNRDWRERRLAKKTAENARLAEELAEERKRRTALEELYAKPEDERGPNDTLVTKDEAVKLAREQLQREAYFANINKAADNMFDAGAKAYPKTWEARVSEAADVFGQEIAAKPEFLEAVTDLDNAADVYHDLAGNPDEMERVLGLPPHKMALELAKISTRLAKPPAARVSRAPAPITPLDRAVVEDTDLENCSMEEFDRRMSAAEAKRYAGRV